MDIRTIYETLNKLGYAKSQVEFSRFWLGRSARYYSHLLATGREPGVGTLSALEWRLSTFLSEQEDVAHMRSAIRASVTRRSVIEPVCGQQRMR